MLNKNILYKDLSGFGEEHVSRVHAISMLLNDLHKAKEKIYNMSFARRGMVGVWMNLGRKYDNIETMASDEKYFDIQFIDALADVAVYAMKMISIIMVLDPGLFMEWINAVYTRYVDGDLDVPSMFDDKMADMLRNIKIKKGA